MSKIYSAKDIAELQRQNAELQRQLSDAKSINTSVRFKVGDKGGISVFVGSQRFPVTLYADQWTLVLDHADDLRQFMVANQSR